MNQRPGRLVAQIVVVILVLGIVLVVLSALGVFSPKTPGSHEVTFRITGNTSAAVITYTLEDGAQSAPQNVSVPWKKAIRYEQSLAVILTAGNPTQTGSISCVLLLDGEEWKKDTATSPSDKVSCAGIVP